MLIRFFLRFPLIAILLHVFIGYLIQLEPITISIFYVVLSLLAIVEIIATRDHSNLAAYYGLYIAGMEILNRMSKSAIFWEFGKYSCIGIFGLASLLSTSYKSRPFLLLIYFLLLLPGLAVSAIYGGMDEDRIWDLASQYLSGPLALAVVGWYFYQRRFEQAQIKMLLRVGILPSIALITLLFLGKSLSEIDFIRGSNFEASGGFGPNQVSSALGWGIVLVIIGMLFNLSVTGYRLLDIILLLLLVFRGLLTFSRGGMIGAFGAIGISIIVLTVLSNTYRKQLKSTLPKIIGGLLLLFSVAYIANDLTGNFLLFRYQGKSTSEVILGRSNDEKEYFSGREDILQGELAAFVENPFLGIGIGRGTVYREADSRSTSVASHTEFTRMLGEHGIFGLLAMICAFFLLPFKHFQTLTNDINRQWMVTFIFLTFFTLAHSGMRLALPSMAFGLAFILIMPLKKP